MTGSAVGAVVGVSVGTVGAAVGELDRPCSNRRGVPPPPSAPATPSSAAPAHANEGAGRSSSRPPSSQRPIELEPIFSAEWGASRSRLDPVPDTSVAERELTLALFTPATSSATASLNAVRKTVSTSEIGKPVTTTVPSTDT